MKAMTKTLAGAAAAALMTVGAAAPAEAQYRTQDHRYYDRDRGIDAGDIVAGVAILGGIAAIAAALGNDGDRYYDRGYDRRYGDRYGYDRRRAYEVAVNSCGYEAQRHARHGQVRITDVDRVSRGRYRVRGVLESYSYRGYDRYDHYGRYDRGDRYGRYDRRGYDRDRFTCYAYGNGRIQDFRVRG